MYQSILLIVLLCHFNSHAQDEDCDFSVYMEPGNRYQIRNPNYPNSFKSGSQCRWIAYCPSGYNSRIDCTLVMSQSPSCNLDKFLVSRKGDPMLASSDNYCGKGTISAVSSAQAICLGLIISRNSPGGNLSCIAYAQAASPPSCTCGYKKMNRIVGGQETSPNEYPMMAAIYFKDQEAIKCGATIISTRHVVTAAHCVVNKTPAQINVLVGVHNTDNSPAKQTLTVSSITIHPNYKPLTYDRDIAIVSVNPSMIFNGIVGPACLPNKYVNSDFTGRQIIVLGWGTLYAGGPISKELREVFLNVISQNDCQRNVPTLTSQQLCTYAKGKDACQDDSGGPGLYSDPSTGLQFLIGIVSYGKFCASNSPGINTRITALLDWIVQNAPADYCRKQINFD